MSRRVILLLRLPLAVLLLAAACSDGGAPAEGVGDPGGGEGARPTRSEVTILPAHEHPPGLPADHEHDPDGTPLVGGRALDPAAYQGFRRITVSTPRSGDVVGRPARLEVLVEGFALVAPNGDASGATGALYVLVDRPAPEGGARIASGQDVTTFWADSVELDLPPGPHTLTVVAADGYGVPFDPPVTATVDVTVGT